MILLGLSILWGRSLYFFFTVPAVTYGGQYVEALVQAPLYVNPLLSPRSRLTDKVLSRVIFSSLYTYDKDALLKPDLAESFERNDDGKEYVLHLRKDVFWHDGKPFTAEDVLVTIDIARDVAYGAAGVSNEMRLVWHEVTVEKRDDYTIVFKLPKARADFLHSLTFGILPAHRWSDVSPEQFQITELNRKPLGTGPYEFVESTTDEAGNVTQYTLRAYERYHKGKPFITKMIFKFFPDRLSAIDAYNSGTVSGIVVDRAEHVNAIKEVSDSSTFETLSLPSYFAVFLNQTKSKPLAFDEVREALTFSVNRDQIVQEVFTSIAQPLSSPFLPGMLGYDPEAQQPEFNLEEAVNRLESKGWQKGDDGIRVKDDTRLAFTLHVDGNSDQLRAVADLLSRQWREIGAQVNVIADEQNLGENVIRPRAYESIIEAHPMRWDQPQLFPLWHSSGKEDTGQNFALIQDTELDDALTELQKESDGDKRSLLYQQVQKRILVEDPAIFLFAPGFVYIHKNNLKNVGVERANSPQDRFTNVEEWSIREKRVFGYEES